MKFKTNDTVKVIAGKNKGKTGKILQILTKLNKASVEGVNLLTKNLRPRKEGEKGQRITFPSPIEISNLAVICPKCGKKTGIGFKLLENNKKGRVCKKCQEVID